jgi:hypothetical protein
VGFSKLAEALNAGEDPHLMVAATALGKPYEWCKANKTDSEVDNGRQTGKVANFGFAGGLGAEKLCFFARKAYNVRLSIDQARELKRNWLATWPEFVHYFAKMSADQRLGIPVEHLFSRRLRGGLTYTSRCNTYFQGLGADATGASSFLISEAQYTLTPCNACDGAANGCEWCRPCHGPGISPMYGARMVNYIHDDFLNECCEPWGHEVSHELVRLMVKGAAPYLPDVPATAKPLLSRFWSKESKQVWRNGRLIPWDYHEELKLRIGKAIKTDPAWTLSAVNGKFLKGLLDVDQAQVANAYEAVRSAA